jgi:hypothetical protein
MARPYLPRFRFLNPHPSFFESYFFPREQKKFVLSSYFRCFVSPADPTLRGIFYGGVAGKKKKKKK